MWLIIINCKEIETAPWYEAQVSRISQNFQMWLVWRSFNCKDELENHKAAGCAKQCVCKACNVDYLYLDERLGHEFQFFFVKMKPSPKKTDKYFSHWSYSLWKCNLKYPNICFQTWWAQISAWIVLDYLINVPKTQGGQATNSQENIVIRFETPECMCCICSVGWW